MLAYNNHYIATGYIPDHPPPAAMDNFGQIQFRTTNGVPLALIGYAVTYKSLMGFVSGGSDHPADLARFSYRHVIDSLQRQLRIPLYVAVIENHKEVEHMICCFASSSDPFYDCEAMMEMSVPESFQVGITAWFELRSRLRRIIVRKGTLYDSEAEPLEEEMIADMNRRSLQKKSPPNQANALDKTMAPLYNFPVEILLKIFHAVVETSTDDDICTERQRYAIILSQVDSTFRSIMIGTPMMWAYISISNRRGSWEMANTCYVRSRSCPLHVKIDIQKSTVQLEEIIVPLKANESRLETLDVRPNSETQVRLSRALNRLRTPHLKHLLVSSGSDLPNDWNLGLLPVATGIQSLTVHAANPRWQLINYSGLTTLKMTHTDHLRNVNDLFTILPKFPRLVNLMFQAISTPSTPRLIEPGFRIELPVLRRLEVTRGPHTLVQFIISVLHAPLLETFHFGMMRYLFVRSTDWDTHPFVSFPSVTNFRITTDDWPYLDVDQLATFDMFFSRMIQQVPNTINLTINGSDYLKAWMFHNRKVGKEALNKMATLTMPSRGKVSQDEYLTDLKTLRNFLNMRRKFKCERLKHVSIQTEVKRFGPSSSDWLQQETELVDSIRAQVDRFDLSIGELGELEVSSNADYPRKEVNQLYTM